MENSTNASERRGPVSDVQDDDVDMVDVNGQSDEEMVSADGPGDEANKENVAPNQPEASGMVTSMANLSVRDREPRRAGMTRVPIIGNGRCRCGVRLSANRRIQKLKARVRLANRMNAVLQRFNAVLLDRVEMDALIREQLREQIGLLNQLRELDNGHDGEGFDEYDPFHIVNDF